MYKTVWLVLYLGLCHDVLGVEYKAKQNRCRELGVLPKFQSKNSLKIQQGYSCVKLIILKVRKDFMLFKQRDLSLFIVKWVTVADFSYARCFVS